MLTQIARYDSTSLTEPNSVRQEFGVPDLLPYRRLYLGGFFRGVTADSLWTCRVTFTGGKSVGSGAELRFAWKQKGALYTNAAVPFDFNFVAVPPFSVELIPDGSAAEFPSAVPAQADELIVPVTDLIENCVRLVRMMPIPLHARADKVIVEWRAGYASSTGTLPSFTGVVGVRSSEVPL